jgi:hypothetical protein
MSKGPPTRVSTAKQKPGCLSGCCLMTLAEGAAMAGIGAVLLRRRRP